MLTDTHAHLTMDQFGDIEDVVKRAREAGVTRIINASFDLDSSRKSVALAEKYPGMYAAVGIHPHHAETVDDKAVAELKDLAGSNKVIAIGETGLDYFENPVPKEVQIKAYERHLDLAMELGMPVILHGREAGEDMIDMLKSKDPIRGVFHCFSEDAEYAKRVLELGFYISFTAIITFKNAHRMREAVQAIPLEKMMIETDCPYLAPQVFRGRRNEPAFVRTVAEKISEIKNIDYDAVADITTRNAVELFSLK